MPRRSKRKKAKEPEAPPKLSLPRLPCTGAHACGVLMCMHVHEDSAKARAFVAEGVLAARVLRAVARPAHPMALAATEEARGLISAADRALWDIHRPLELSGPLRAMHEASRASKAGRWLRPWEHALLLSKVHKLQALLDSPFARTVFLDCDLFVLDASLIDGLLTQTLRQAELAMPIDPWRGGLWQAAPAPPLCSALAAYRAADAGVRQLLVEAAGRLINGTERALHPDVHWGDQAALWFAYVLAAPRLRLRVAALPEEALCAGELLSSTHVLEGTPPRVVLRPFAHLRTSWAGVKDQDRRGEYPCRAVHGHDYTEDQFAPLLGLPPGRSRAGGAGAEAGAPPAREGLRPVPGGRRGWLPDGY